jgi:hypothetical protein
MQSFIQNYYSFFETYNERREKTEVSLFRSPETANWDDVTFEQLEK